MSEKTSTKEITKCRGKFFWRVTAKKKNPTSKAVPGAYSDQRETPGDTWNTPKKWFLAALAALYLPS